MIEQIDGDDFFNKFFFFLGSDILEGGLNEDNDGGLVQRMMQILISCNFQQIGYKLLLNDLISK